MIYAALQESARPLLDSLRWQTLTASADDGYMFKRLACRPMGLMLHLAPCHSLHRFLAHRVKQRKMQAPWRTWPFHTTLLAAQVTTRVTGLSGSGRHT